MPSKAERLPFVAARVIHARPGRVRIRLQSWKDAAPEQVEAALLTIQGVRVVCASALTGSVWIRFDSATLPVAALLAGAAGSIARAMDAETQAGATMLA